MKSMTTLDRALKFHQKIINFNWYVFGAVLLTVGMFLITSHLAWFIISVPVIWLFGMSSAAVIGGNIAKRRWEDEFES